MESKRSSLYHMMSNPNTNALTSLLNDAVRDPKVTAAVFKIVYVGKDKYPLGVLEMTPVEADEWKKKRGIWKSILHYTWKNGYL